MLTAPAVTPAPQPITRTDRASSRHQRRQMAEHPLQAHVLRLARRLDLARVVVAEAAVRQPRDGHRRVESLARIQHLAGLPLHGRREPSVRDQQAPARAGRRRAATHRAPPAAISASGARRDRPGERRARIRAPPQPRGSTSASSAAARAAIRSRDEHAGLRRARPTTAPMVFAAYTAPTSRAESRSVAATDASASGKLAPQKNAGGRTAHSVRTKSISKSTLKPGDSVGRDGPVRKRHRQLVRRPGDGGRRQQLATGERHARPRHVLCQHRPGGAAAAKADQERGQDDRERVDRRAEEQADLTRPDHFAGERGEPRQRDGEVDVPSCGRPAEAGRYGAYRLAVASGFSRTDRIARIHAIAATTTFNPTATNVAVAMS